MRQSSRGSTEGPVWVMPPLPRRCGATVIMMAYGIYYAGGSLSYCWCWETRCFISARDAFFVGGGGVPGTFIPREDIVDEDRPFH